MLLCVALVAAMGAAAYAIDPAPTPAWEMPAGSNPAYGTAAENAVSDTTMAKMFAQRADNAEAVADVLKEVRAAVATWEAVRDSETATQPEIGAAYTAFVASLNAITTNVTAENPALLAQTGGTDQTLAVWLTPANYTGMPAAAVFGGVNVPQQTANVHNTAAAVGTAVSTAQAFAAANDITAAQYALAADYDMSSHSQMDWNTYIIGATAKEQAHQTSVAQSAANAAKAGALTAQSTAKSLINQAMKVAQDAAAEAVANAQATAYNNLSAAYATAVADFWDGVAAEIATW